MRGCHLKMSYSKLKGNPEKEPIIQLTSGTTWSVDNKEPVIYYGRGGGATKQE